GGALAGPLESEGGGVRRLGERLVRMPVGGGSTCGVEDVIDDLEGEADVFPVGGQATEGRRWGAPEQRSHPHGGPQERAGLASMDRLHAGKAYAVTLRCQGQDGPDPLAAGEEAVTDRLAEPRPARGEVARQRPVDELHPGGKVARHVHVVSPRPPAGAEEGASRRRT